ncbi:MAG: hypothetical protein HND48_24170 [Chloroflexi bacterium]|nr:hypothetical protein [Chloroflexota bacterium]
MQKGDRLTLRISHLEPEKRRVGFTQRWGADAGLPGEVPPAVEVVEAPPASELAADAVPPASELAAEDASAEDAQDSSDGGEDSSAGDLSSDGGEGSSADGESKDE